MTSITITGNSNDTDVILESASASIDSGTATAPSAAPAATPAAAPAATPAASPAAAPAAADFYSKTIPATKPTGYNTMLWGATDLFSYFATPPTAGGFGLDKSYIVADAALSNCWVLEYSPNSTAHSMMDLVFYGVLDSTLPTYSNSAVSSIFPHSFPETFVTSTYWKSYEAAMGPIYRGEYELGGVNLAAPGLKNGRNWNAASPDCKYGFTATGLDFMTPSPTVINDVSANGTGYSVSRLNELFANAIEAAIVLDSSPIVQQVMAGADFSLSEWGIWLVVTHMSYITKASSVDLSAVSIPRGGVYSLPTAFDYLGTGTLASALDPSGRHQSVITTTWNSQKGSEGFRRALLDQWNIPYSMVYSPMTNFDKVTIDPTYELNPPEFPPTITPPTLAQSAAFAIELIAETMDVPVPSAPFPTTVDASGEIVKNYTFFDLSNILTYPLCGQSVNNSSVSIIDLDISNSAIKVTTTNFPGEDFRIFATYNDISNNKKYFWADASHVAMTALNSTMNRTIGEPTVSSTGTNQTQTELVLVELDTSGSTHSIRGLKCYYDVAMRPFVEKDDYVQEVITLIMWQMFGLRIPTVFGGQFVFAPDRAQANRDMADELGSKWIRYLPNVDHLEDAFDQINTKGIVLSLALTPTDVFPYMNVSAYSNGVDASNLTVLPNGPVDISENNLLIFKSIENDPKIPVNLEIIDPPGYTSTDLSGAMAWFIEQDKVLYYAKGLITDPSQSSFNRTYTNIVFRNYLDFSACVHDASYGSTLTSVLMDISSQKDLTNTYTGFFNDFSAVNINVYPTGPDLATTSHTNGGNRYANYYSSLLVNDTSGCVESSVFESDVSNAYQTAIDTNPAFGQTYITNNYAGWEGTSGINTAIAVFGLPDPSSTYLSNWDFSGSLPNPTTITNFLPSTTLFGNDVSSNLVVNALTDPSFSIHDMPAMLTCQFDLSGMPNGGITDSSSIFIQSNDMWRYTAKNGEILSADITTISGDPTYNPNTEYLVHWAPNFSTFLYSFMFSLFNTTKVPGFAMPSVFSGNPAAPSGLDNRVTLYGTAEQKAMFNSYTSSGLYPFNAYASDDLTIEFVIVDEVLVNKKIAKTL